MYILYYGLISLIILRINADQVVSDESKDDPYARQGKHTYSNAERRFGANLDDEDWHISHLKDTDFSPKISECADTFENKVKRYRKSLQNDGAMVEFVSADALPFNVNDLEKDICKVPNKQDLFKASLQEKQKAVVNATITKEKKAKDSKFKIANKAEKLNVATTTEQDGKVKKNEKDSRRASEYLFSSVEYYDESVPFDDGMCPDDVEVIELELDHIRNYDLHCEQTLIWRSLE